MLPLLLALVPVAILQTWLFGVRVLLLLVAAVGVAVVTEAVILYFRGRAVGPALRDGSAAVAGALLGLAVAPGLALWQLALGTIFAVAAAKHAYGGIGRNPFNPAMAGYAFLLVSFPAELAVWPATMDGLSGATPLDTAHALARGAEVPDVTTPGQTSRVWTHPQSSAAAAFAWLNIAWLAGGCLLVKLGIIHWRMPTAVLLGIGVAAWVASMTGGTAPFWQHWFTGASMAAAFFIATDPVSAPRSVRAAWPFGLLIGMVVVVIREYGAYPDGVAFAVLLANCIAPLLDRLYGRGDRSDLGKPGDAP